MASPFASLRQSWRSSCKDRGRRTNRSRARLALERLEGRALLTIAFAPPVAVDFPGDFPFSVASGHFFNQDGPADLAVATSGGVQVLKNNGSGSFDLGPRLLALPGWEQYTSSVTAGDLNHDGYDDLVVGRQVIGDVAVLLYNPGTLQFDTPTFYDAGPGFTYVGNNLSIGDLNGDGHPDLVAANSGPSNVAVLLNDGTGHFSGLPYLFDGGSFVSIADLDGDTRPDVVVGRGGGVSVMLNESPPDSSSVVFGAPMDLGAGPDVVGFAVANLGGNALPDVVVATTSPFDVSSTVRVFINNGNGSFAPAAVDPVSTGSYAKSVTTGDFDGNGTVDLAVFATVYHTVLVPSPIPSDPPGTLIPAQVPNDAVSVLSNDGDATFESLPPLEISDSDSTAGNVIAVDLNNDGTKDLVTANNWSERITLFFNPRPAATPAGSDIQVQPTDPVTGTSPMEITFSSVTVTGATTVTSSGTDGLPPPANFALPNLATPIYFDVHTTAAFAGPAEVRIDYDPAGVIDESALRLFHYENGQWIDVTTSVDTAAHTISGVVGSFSPFAVFAFEPTVRIDVLQDSVNLNQQGVISVAILGTADFDARLVDAATVHFAGAAAVHWATQDVNHDGAVDLVLQFRVQDTALRAIYEQSLLEDENADSILDSTQTMATAQLTGETVDHLAFQGTDRVKLFLAGQSLRQLLTALFGG